LNPTDYGTAVKPIRPHLLAALLAACGLALATGTQASAPSWTRIPHPALEGGATVAYITDLLPPGDGSGWLAGGFVVDSDGTRRPSIWSSRDAATWQRADLPPTTAPERRDGVYMIARHGPNLVAVGDRFDNGLRVAAWYSDGQRWRALTEPDDPLLSYQPRIWAVAETPQGFLAVGAGHSSTQSLVRVFTSADGSRWSVHSTLPLPNGQRFQPLDAVAVGEKILLVGDTVSGSAKEGRIWVWNGSVWSQVDAQAAQMSGGARYQVSAVAHRSGVGYVAGGVVERSGSERPAAWFSEDATTWTRVPDQAFPPAGDEGIHEIVSSADGFLAAGNSFSGPRLWRSTNGRAWIPVPTPSTPSVGGERINVATARGVAVLAFTRETGADLFRRAPTGKWATVDKPPAFPAETKGGADLRSVATNGLRLVAVGNDAASQPLILVSKNAAGWTRVPFPDRAARFTAVTVSRGVWAIAGWRLIEGRARVALWTSTDARSWRRIGGTKSWPIGVFADVAADGPRFALVAFEGSTRGLQTTVWAADRFSAWPVDSLGPGEARAICVGPNGATVVAIRGEGTAERVITWQRGRSRTWSRDPDVTATAADASRCADGPPGTVVVGSNGASSVAWIRSRPDGTWEERPLTSTFPPSALYGIARNGRGFLVTGSTGSRGQVDLVVWSTDGANWSLLGGSSPPFAEKGYQAGSAIARHGGKIVVVGRTGAGNGAIWVGPADPPSGPPPVGS